jgi:O-antigen/teichoic acid export membrane protein
MSSLTGRLKDLIPKGQVTRSVTLLVGGATLGQGIVILISPLLTRLYAPEHFGILAVYAALLSVVVVVASLRYEVAIPLPEEQSDAANLLALSLGLVLIISLLATLGIFLAGHVLITALNATALAPYLWFLPAGTALAGTYQALNYWAVRTRAFPSIACTKVSQGLGTAFTQVALGLLNLGPIGLIGGHIVGQAAGSITLATLAWRDNRNVLQQVNIPGMCRMAVRYRKFPVFSSLSGFANVASLQVVVLLLSSFYDPVVLGLYALGQRIIQIPMGIVTSAVAQVFYREAVEAHQEGTLYDLVRSTYLKLALVAVGPFLIMLFSAPTLFAIIFGERWREAGEYTRLLLPWLFLMFLNSPITSLIAVLEKQQAYLLYDILLMASRAAALYLSAVYIGDPYTSILWYGIVGFVFNFGLLFYLLHLGRATHVT